MGDALKVQPSAMSDEEWVNMQVPALSMIWLRLFPEVLLQVLSFDTPIKLWDGLKEIYNKKFVSTHLHTLMKVIWEVISFKMTEDRTLAKHTDSFNLIAIELATMNARVHDELKAPYPFNFIPTSNENLSQTIMYEVKIFIWWDNQHSFKWRYAKKCTPLRFL